MVKSIVVLAFVLVVCLMFVNVNADIFTDEKGNPCPCATTDDIRRVCGSDGVTYINVSTLKCQNQCKKTNIQVVKESQC